MKHRETRSGHVPPQPSAAAAVPRAPSARAAVEGLSLPLSREAYHGQVSDLALVTFQHHSVSHGYGLLPGVADTREQLSLVLV